MSGRRAIGVRVTRSERSGAWRPASANTHLAQRLKEVVGVTPKRLARTYRFTATVLAIDPAGPVDRAEPAGRAGYDDQAHFGDGFRAFTG